MPSLTLFHAPPDPGSQAARLVLAETGTPWAERVIDAGPALEQYTPWYLRLNPTGGLPTLVHDGTVITRLPRILRRLQQVAQAPSLYPEDEPGRAEADAWLERVAQVDVAALQPPGPIAQVARAHARRTLLELAWHQQDLAPQAQGALRRLDQPDPEGAERQLIACLDAAEQALSDGRRYLLGEEWTLADAALTPLLAAASRSGRAYLAARSQRPQLARWWGRVRRRPSYRAADIHERTHPWTWQRRLRYALPRLAVGLAAIATLRFILRRLSGSARDRG